MSSKIFILSWLVSFAWGFDIPPGLRLGAGTSASQIEGGWSIGKSENIIDHIFHENSTNGTPDVACNSYFLWKRDVEVAKELGLQYYRFSISWSRLLPSGFPDYINSDGVLYYNNLINALLANDIEPVITLFHFDLPQSLQELGGYDNPQIGDWLASYVRVAFDLYGDRVKTWLTVNEPLIASFLLSPLLFPVGFNPYRISKNLLIAHAKAWRVYDTEFRDKQKGKITLVNLLFWYEPDTEEDEELAEKARQLASGLYSHPVYSKEGGWPEVVKTIIADYSKAQGNATSLLPEFTDEEIELVRGTHDFYALNYYTSRVIRKAKPGEEVGQWPFFGSEPLDAILEARPYWMSTGDESIKIVPEGLRYQLQWLREQYGDMEYMITENGCPSGDNTLGDDVRVDYIRGHVEQVLLAREEGLDVIGYTVWSMMDDFEFVSGYTIGYGLYQVNFSDPWRPRVPRKSAYFYRTLTDSARRHVSAT